MLPLFDAPTAAKYLKKPSAPKNGRRRAALPEPGVVADFAVQNTAGFTLFQNNRHPIRINSQHIHYAGAGTRLSPRSCFFLKKP